jgi:hypothetical protein
LSKWERRFEEIKDGKPLSNLMMTDETMLKLATMQDKKVIVHSTRN